MALAVCHRPARPALQALRDRLCQDAWLENLNHRPGNHCFRADEQHPVARPAEVSLKTRRFLQIARPVFYAQLPVAPCFLRHQLNHRRGVLLSLSRGVVPNIQADTPIDCCTCNISAQPNGNHTSVFSSYRSSTPIALNPNANIPQPRQRPDKVAPDAPPACGVVAF